MRKEKSIHEIQELINDKLKDEAAEILCGPEAGSERFGIWYDWHCNDWALIGRTAKFTTFIKALSGEWTKTHYIWLKNNCPFDGDLYDDIRISPIDQKIESYNVGYSMGNGNTRDREVFDTRSGIVVDYPVKNNKEAAALVNKLMDRSA